MTHQHRDLLIGFVSSILVAGLCVIYAQDPQVPGPPVTIHAVPALPTAVLATRNTIYLWVNAATQNTCPASGAAGAQGSGTAVAFCLTLDGSNWRSVMLMSDTTGNITLPGTAVNFGGWAITPPSTSGQWKTQ